MTTSWLVPHQHFLQQQILQNKLPHALIVSGVKGAGKYELAMWLAQSLLCQQADTVQQIPCGKCKGCHLVSQAIHPDLLQVELTTNHISIDQVRAVSRFLEKTAQFGLNQVVVIQDTDKLTESAGNALLKTLEEPTKHSFIILIAQDEQRLLPTLISRCRVLSIRPPIGEKLLNEVGRHSEDKFVNLSHLPELTDDELALQFHALRQDCYQFFSTLQGRMALASKIKATEHGERWFEKIVSDMYRLSAQWLSGEQQYLPEQTNSIPSDPEQLWRVYNLIKENNKKQVQLSQYNREFALEKLLVEVQLLLQNNRSEHGTTIS